MAEIPMLRTRAAALAWAVPLIHIPTILAAGVLTPEYHSARGAISNLGSTRAPYHALVNILGLIVPGVLLALSAFTLRFAGARPAPPARGVVVVGLAGCALVGCGLISMPSLRHLAMSLPADLLAAAGLILLGPWASRAFASRGWIVTAYIVAAVLLVDAISWGLAFRYPPLHPYLGIQQRLGVFGSFVWWAALTTRLAREDGGIAPSTGDDRNPILDHVARP
jgi:hypothetical membrane protein